MAQPVERGGQASPDRLFTARSPASAFGVLVPRIGPHDGDTKKNTPSVEVRTNPPSTWREEDPFGTPCVKVGGQANQAPVFAFPQDTKCANPRQSAHREAVEPLRAKNPLPAEKPNHIEATLHVEGPLHVQEPQQAIKNNVR